MQRKDVESCIRGCAEFFKERYGNMQFDCWLCKESVKGQCGGIEFVDATINQYLADDEPVVAPEPTQEPILITEQLSFF